MGKQYQETHFTSDDARQWRRIEALRGHEGFRQGDRLPLWASEWNWSTWGREFKEAWDERLMLWRKQTVAGAAQA